MSIILSISEPVHVLAIVVYCAIIFHIVTCNATELELYFCQNINELQGLFGTRKGRANGCGEIHIHLCSQFKCFFNMYTKIQMYAYVMWMFIAAKTLFLPLVCFICHMLAHKCYHDKMLQNGASLVFTSYIFPHFCFLVLQLRYCTNTSKVQV